MRIKEDLPQFKDGPALILVSGDQSGIIYFASKGEIDKVAEFKETTVPKGKEGFFERRVKRGFHKVASLGVGAADEHSEEKAQEKFTKEFAASAKHFALSRSATELYLFSPVYFERTLFDALDELLKKITVLGVHGIFIKEHPFTILKKIKESYGVEEPEKLPSVEAQKLLTKKDSSVELSQPHAKAEKVRAFMARKKNK